MNPRLFTDVSHDGPTNIGTCDFSGGLVEKDVPLQGNGSIEIKAEAKSR